MAAQIGVSAGPISASSPARAKAVPPGPARNAQGGAGTGLTQEQSDDLAAALISRGTWSDAVTYGSGDLVEHTGAAYYLPSGTSLNEEPGVDGDWVELGAAGTTIADEAVTDAKLRHSAALSVIGRSANSTGDPADIAGTDGQVLRVAGTTLGFGTIVAAGIASNAVETAKINDAAVTLAKQANLAADTIIGRANGAGTGVPQALTATQVRTILNVSSGAAATAAQGTLADSATQPGDAVTTLTGTAHRIFYTDGAGAIQELALGADGTFLRFNGATSAPTAGTPAGSGDVSKVGTPADNQVGVWTGDGTLEGTSGLTYNGSALGVTGNVTVSGTVDGRDVAADGTKLDGIEAAADVTDATNVDAAGAVMNSDYNANTILAATTDNTPAAVTVAEQTLVGRITGGAITALSIAQVLTLLGLDGAANVQTATWDSGTTYNPNDVVVDDDSLYLQNSGTTSTGDDPASGAPWLLLCRGITSAERSKLSGIEALADVTDATNVDAAGAVMESDFNANTILAANADNTPAPVTIDEQRIAGRITGGNITGLTAAQVRTLINVEDGAAAPATGEELVAAIDAELGSDTWQGGGGGGGVLPWAQFSHERWMFHAGDGAWSAFAVNGGTGVAASTVRSTFGVTFTEIRTDAASANSGATWTRTSTVLVPLGWRMRLIFRTPADLTALTAKMGFWDSESWDSSAAPNGIGALVSGSTMTLACRVGASQTSHGSTATLSVDTEYQLDILREASTARITLYEDDGATVVLQGNVGGMPADTVPLYPQLQAFHPGTNPGSATAKLLLAYVFYGVDPE